jgi:hypothetical protein
VLKTYYGILQSEQGLRRAAYLIHCSLVDKKNRVEINKFWPLPLDDKKSKGGELGRLGQRILEQRKQKEQRD